MWGCGGLKDRVRIWLEFYVRLFYCGVLEKRGYSIFLGFILIVRVDL